MHVETVERLRHSHDFEPVSADSERRTRWVVGLTVVTMAVEIVAGFLTRSMALLADGWHMGTHAAALGVAVFAYRYARRHAADPLYTFGTGKVSVLGGFASAIFLAVVAVLVAVEAVRRLLAPLRIDYGSALLVAVLGLVVNLASAWLLTARGRYHDHDDSEGHGGTETPSEHRDHNYRAAYLHVLSDALTSVLAIIALLAGRLLGWGWMDPLIGIVASAVIGRWSYGLLRDTGKILLDGDVLPEATESIRRAIEKDADNRVADLHVWRVGSNEQAAIICVVTHNPRPPDYYRGLLAGFPNLKHVSIEVNQCPSCDA